MTTLIYFDKDKKIKHIQNLLLEDPEPDQWIKDCCTILEVQENVVSLTDITEITETEIEIHLKFNADGSTAKFNKDTLERIQEIQEDTEEEPE